MSDDVSVTVLDNGPLRIANVRSATYCGQAIEIEGDLFLCRCGGSSNAPFCDGTHRSNDFDGSSGPGTGKEVVLWEGATVRTFFNPNICMHARYCKPLKELRERELGGDAAAATEIMRVVASCPSGALTYETKSIPGLPATTEGQVDLEIMEGGEVRVHSTFEINASHPDRQPTDRATLCRCGLSKNKPWCDGRHAGRKDFK